MKSSRSFKAAVAVIVLAVVLVLVQRKAGDASTSSSASTGNASSDAAAPPPRVRPSRGSSREADRLLAAEGTRTDVTLSTFPIKEYQQLRPPAGKAAGAPVGEAFIHVPSAGRRIAMESNQIGEFPAIETKLNDTVGVRLALDSVKPGTPVRIVILDGGSFPATAGATQLLAAAKWGGTAFEYTTSGNVGFHRVLVEAKGQSARILNFSAHDASTRPAPSTASTN